MQGTFAETCLWHQLPDFDNEIDLGTLLELGADSNALDFKVATPLANAIRYRSPRSAELLLKRGADIRTKDYAGNTILHKAAHPRDPKVLCILLEANLMGIDVNARNAGQAAMELAQAYEPKLEGSINMFQALFFGIQNHIDYESRAQYGATYEELQVAGTEDPYLPGAWPNVD